VCVSTWDDKRCDFAFASNRSGGHFEIFVMQSDGSHVRQLTTTPTGITNT